jgi:hypothetical protein
MRFDMDSFFSRKTTSKETAIRLPGGKLIVPGHAKTARGIGGLVVRAIKGGKARVEVA